MQFSKSKSTKRFNFNISRDTKSHKVGANTVSIVTNPVQKILIRLHVHKLQ
jgi:hypothetical protein